VGHKILLTKIDKMLPSWFTSWIAQYLSGRKQRVKCNNKHSEWLNVIAGVTQGSVLGPALFLLFISDMNEYLPTTAFKQTDYRIQAKFLRISIAAFSIQDLWEYFITNESHTVAK
jgi:ribonuclease P/MRP protein subunit RPP40